MTETGQRRGLLFVLVGPGGVGKNTLMNRVMAQLDNLRQLPTATTRPPRDNEQQGREHLFVSLAEFQAMQQRGELLEQQEVTPGKWYGVPRQTVENAMDEGRDQIADIEYLGARILRRAYPQGVVLVFIAPPEIDSLEIRMRERGTDTSIIRERMERALSEMAFAPECDYLLVNDDLEQTTRRLHDLIVARKTGDDVAALSVQREGVRFTLTVLPSHSDSVLVRDDSSLLQTRVRSGETTEQAAAALLSATGFRLADSGLTGFALIAPDDPIAPVTVDFDPVAGRYAVHFIYQYMLEDAQLAPPGFQWQPRAQVAAMIEDKQAEQSGT